MKEIPYSRVESSCLVVKFHYDILKLNKWFEDMTKRIRGQIQMGARVQEIVKNRNQQLNKLLS